MTTTDTTKTATAESLLDELMAAASAPKTKTHPNHPMLYALLQTARANFRKLRESEIVAYNQSLRGDATDYSAPLTARATAFLDATSDYRTACAASDVKPENTRGGFNAVQWCSKTGMAMPPKTVRSKADPLTRTIAVKMPWEAFVALGATKDKALACIVGALTTAYPDVDFTSALATASTPVAEDSDEMDTDESES